MERGVGQQGLIHLGIVGKQVRRHADKDAASNKGLGPVRVRGAKPRCAAAAAIEWLPEETVFCAPTCVRQAAVAL
jgi:hypothetical protein